jgi:hypothetical protein
MDSLNQHIDNAERFQPQPDHEMPVVDQSTGINLALSMAQRASAVKAPEQIAQMPAILPVAN